MALLVLSFFGVLLFGAIFIKLSYRTIKSLQIGFTIFASLSHRNAPLKKGTTFVAQWAQNNAENNEQMVSSSR